MRISDRNWEGRGSEKEKKKLLNKEIFYGFCKMIKFTNFAMRFVCLKEKNYEN